MRETERPDSTGEPIYFAPKPGTFSQVMLGAAFFAAMTSVGPYMILQGGIGSLIIGCVFIASFGSLTLACLMVGVGALSRYRLDESGIERLNPIKTRRISWERIESAWQRGFSLTTLRLMVDGKPDDIDMSALPSPRTFEAAFRSHLLNPEVPILPRKFASRWPLALCVCGAAMYPVATILPHRGFTVTLALLGIVFAALGFIQGTKSYETTTEGLWIRTPFGSRLLRFGEIQRMGVDTYSIRAGPIRRITLDHADGELVVTSALPDFALLQAFLRAHLDPARIRDSAA